MAKKIILRDKKRSKYKERNTSLWFNQRRC